jgi:hypothetical protein
MFDRLYYDILYLIAGEIFSEERQDLLSFCLVSKQSYSACVPWIYRVLTIDLFKVE